MKVYTLALALLFTSGSLEAAKRIKTPKSTAAKGYKAKRNTHALKTHRGSSKSRHTQAKVN